MKKGFTLLELVIVIVIIGILATLGIFQYTRMVERARGGEARSILGGIRTEAAGIWLTQNSGGAAPTVPVGTFTAATLGIGAAAQQLPSTCASAASPGYYFSYAVAQLPAAGLGTGLRIVATRCTVVTAKLPVGPGAFTLTLDVNFQTGTDAWDAPPVLNPYPY